MGLFDMDDKRLQVIYHRVWLECDRGFVNPRQFPDLERAIIMYARENEFSFDEAYILAKTGERIGSLE